MDKSAETLNDEQVANEAKRMLADDIMPDFKGVRRNKLKDGYRSVTVENDRHAFGFAHLIGHDVLIDGDTERVCAVDNATDFAECLTGDEITLILEHLNRCPIIEKPHDPDNEIYKAALEFLKSQSVLPRLASQAETQAKESKAKRYVWLGDDEKPDTPAP